MISFRAGPNTARNSGSTRARSVGSGRTIFPLPTDSRAAIGASGQCVPASPAATGGAAIPRASRRSPLNVAEVPSLGDSSLHLPGRFGVRAFSA